MTCSTSTIELDVYPWENRMQDVLSHAWYLHFRALGREFAVFIKVLSFPFHPPKAHVILWMFVAR